MQRQRKLQKPLVRLQRLQLLLGLLLMWSRSCACLCGATPCSVLPALWWSWVQLPGSHTGSSSWTSSARMKYAICAESPSILLCLPGFPATNDALPEAMKPVTSKVVRTATGCLTFTLLWCLHLLYFSLCPATFRA